MKVRGRAILYTFLQSYTLLYNFKNFYCDPEHFYSILYQTLVPFQPIIVFIHVYYLTKDN